tara:strand:- start:51 stop:317 length:267 start_codon:yes stop_codon:yes gene_type:complete
MPQKGEYKKDASKETKRQRTKNQKPKHKRKRVESNKARRKKGLKPLKGNAGNPARRDEMNHGKSGIKLMSHKKNRSRDNNKNHKKRKK